MDTFEAVGDRCPGTQREPSNCVECETCSPRLEGQRTGRIVLAHILLREVKTTGPLRRGGRVVIEPLAR